jgi:hypothetical protein
MKNKSGAAIAPRIIHKEEKFKQTVKNPPGFKNRITIDIHALILYILYLNSKIQYKVVRGRIINLLII